MASPPTASPRLLAVPSLDDPASATSHHMSPRTNPPPNPPFVFPARNPSSAPSSFSRATGRRPRSAIEMGKTVPEPTTQIERRSRPNALPDFSFNPGAALPPQDNGFLVPPLSPQSPTVISSSSRHGAHGHKRGGSEYVGGSIRDGDSIMNSSPTRPEFGNINDMQPPPNRRGRHAHRRSAALSSHDLSIILQPPAVSASMRGSSAPTSPLESTRKEMASIAGPAHALKPVESEPALKSAAAHEPEPEPEPQPKPVAEIVTTGPSPTKAVPRARVGFSETVEFIPRPLSLISSDTSSTVTARPGHSVSGSISSIMSNTTPITVEKEIKPQSGLSPPRDTTDSRPSTAGAILERTTSTINADNTDISPRRRNSIPTLRQLQEITTEPAEPSPTKTPKRWSFFGLDPLVTKEATPSNEAAAQPECPDVVVVEKATPRSKRKSKKSGKKVKTWAGSILTRKSKPRPRSCIVVNDLAPTDSVTDYPDSLTNRVNQEVEPSPITPEITLTPNEMPTVMLPAPQYDEDSSYPVIDLDAALGPFNTPLPHNPEWEAAQRAAGNTKRRLHSAQGMKGFSGPGMHYHRRAESAPEMVPFESARFSLHRFGSSSTMADVFEEDEEEDGETSSSSSESGSDKEIPLPTKTEGDETPQVMMAGPAAPRQPENDDADAKHPSSPPASQHASPALTAVDTASVQPPRSMRSEPSANSLQDGGIYEETSSVQFRMSNLFQGNASPANSATPSPRRVLAARDLAPVDISPLQLPSVYHAPISPYSMSHSSSFPSPRSPVSIDAQRISTAPSSLNEETSFQSLLLGQPGPEVRISVDDIPSLTSSNSTMTKESAFTHNAHVIIPASLNGQRPASVSSAAFGRRRSSLASLSRLISSSHGERSKLSMEVTCDNEQVKKAKVSKSKRLSRLVQFWKAKDVSTS